jgi:hypothetical protein
LHNNCGQGLNTISHPTYNDFEDDESHCENPLGGGDVSLLSVSGYNKGLSMSQRGGNNNTRLSRRLEDELILKLNGRHSNIENSTDPLKKHKYYAKCLKLRKAVIAILALNRLKKLI